MKELHEFIISNRTEEVIKTLSDPESIDYIIQQDEESGDTALHLAARNKNLHIFEMILEKIASNDIVNIKNKLGSTSLHEALDCTRSLENKRIAAISLKMLNLLLDKKIDLNIRNHLGATALYYAVAFGNLEAVRIMVSKDANYRVKLIKDDENLLQTAIRKGKIDILEYLISLGLEVNSTGLQKPNWAYLRASTSNIRIVDIILDHENPKTIYKKNSDIGNLINYAFYSSNFHLVKRIIERGIDINPTDLDKTAYSEVCYKKIYESKSKIFDLLLELGPKKIDFHQLRDCVVKFQDRHFAQATQALKDIATAEQESIRWSDTRMIWTSLVVSISIARKSSRHARAQYNLQKKIRVEECPQCPFSGSEFFANKTYLYKDKSGLKPTSHER